MVGAEMSQIASTCGQAQTPFEYKILPERGQVKRKLQGKVPLRLSRKTNAAYFLLAVFCAATVQQPE
jgi:hypothetical protein